MHMMRTGAAVCGLLLAATAAFAGRLEFGEPQVQGDTVTIPVMLTGDLGPGVSSIDFSMRYDPAVLAPVNAGPGSASSAADKQVHAHARSEGDYKVVIVGLNQNTVQNGEVASIVMQKVPGTGADSVNMRIVETTFASSDAVQIPSQGDSQTLNLDESGTSQPDPEENNDTTDGNDSTDKPNNENETPNENENGSGSDENMDTPGSTPAPISNDGNAPIYSDSPSAPSVVAGNNGTSGGTAGADSGSTKSATTSTQMNRAVAQADAVRTTLPRPQNGNTTADSNDTQADASVTPGSSDGTMTQTTGSDTMVLAQAETAPSAATADSRETPNASGDTMVKLGADGQPIASDEAAATVPGSDNNMIVIAVVAGVVLAGIGGLIVLRKKLFA